MTDAAPNQTIGQLVRFLAVGGANTVITGAIFLALASMTSRTVAYTAAFAIGIAFAAIVTPQVVFRARASSTRRLRYVLWYLIVYLVGLGAVYVLDEFWRIGTVVIAVTAFIATAGMSFIGARYLFASGPDDNTVLDARHIDRAG